MCDNAGIVRAKATSVRRLKDRMRFGIGLVKGTMAMNMLDQMQTDTGFGATGEVRLIPDPLTWTILPYVPGSAAMLCDQIELDQKPWHMCPRQLLKRQIEKALEMNLSIRAAFEPEFTICTRLDEQLIPIDRSLYGSTEGMNRAAGFISRFTDCLERQNLSVEVYHAEAGAGQHEVSISHASALAACDRHILYKETVKGVATEQGLEAYLAPKPFENQAGNGCHLHMSLWDRKGERNQFWSENGLSDLAKHFVAGLLEHLPALVALTCPSVNSYRRLQPKSWSAAYTCWGYENREAAIRIPSVYWGQEKETTNVEIKAMDSSCNPYLALSAIIACGLDGISRKLMPPPPVTGDPSQLTEKEMAAGQIHRLPANLQEAIERLKDDELLLSMLGTDLARTFLAVRSSEWAFFNAKVSELEFSHHRSRY